MPVDVSALIAEQVKILGSKQAVADRMGISRSAVSLYLAGRYGEVGGRVDRFEALAIAAFGEKAVCPHLGTALSTTECERFRTRALPQSDADALKHWLACRRCALNPAKEASRA